jgi:hypothetical protein
MSSASGSLAQTEGSGLLEDRQWFDLTVVGERPLFAHPRHSGAKRSIAAIIQ